VKKNENLLTRPIFFIPDDGLRISRNVE